MKQTNTNHFTKERKQYTRIYKVRKAMRPYWNNQTMQEGLTDMLTDLMHWAEYFKNKDVDFDSALSQATDHYSYEKG